MPPTEMLTKRTPSAAYFNRSGIPWRKICGASISAASVIAAGSVIKEPSTGTAASPSHTWITAVRPGSTVASDTITHSTITSIGFDAASTMMTNTNSGSVYWRDSRYSIDCALLVSRLMARIRISDQKPNTTSTSPSR